VVAAPAFPLTNQHAPGGHESGFRDLVNQPADLSFVLTQLLRSAQEAGDPLATRIDAGAVAVLGHSLGGATVLGLTRKNCCRDERFRASIFAAAPVLLGDAFGADPLSAEGPPTLIIQGTADHSVAYSNGPQLYGLIQPPRFLLGLADAGHSEALESQAEPAIPARDAAQRATIAFLNAVFRGADTKLDQTLAVLAAAGNIVESEKAEEQ
jgi:predicted dienelactone hydrolase